MEKYVVMPSLGAFGKALGSSGKAILADLGAILADLGAILADLGAILADLGRSWRRTTLIFAPIENNFGDGRGERP